MDLNDTLPAGHCSGFVAVVGRPNVGKSTLVNALVGEKVAIVSSKPQTTRNRLLGILTREDGQVIFVDTPGIHRPLHRLGEVLVETAAAALPDADALLWVVDVSVSPTDEDRQVAALLSQGSPVLPVILALNKCDRVSPEWLARNSASYGALVPRADPLPVSATRGDNLEALLTRVMAALPPGPRFYPEDEFTDQQQRFMAAELVREQALLHLRDEVPHSLAVVVDRFEERGQTVQAPPQSEATSDASGEGGVSALPLTYISMVIYVERDSHKMILLGKGGQMLKKIGQGARQQIEALVGARVYLDLWVKVRPKWRTNEEELRRLGYEPPRITTTRKGGSRRSRPRAG